MGENNNLTESNNDTTIADLLKSGEPGFAYNIPTADAVPVEIKKDWKLKKLTIEFSNWGPNKGQYEGQISFDNKEHESFTFNLYPEMTEQYIKLISEEVVKSAESLSSRLIESLGLKK